MKRSICIVLTVLLLLSGCSKAPLRTEFFAMDTVFALNIYGGENASEAAQEIEAEIARLESLLSVTNENSDIYKINAGISQSANNETVSLINRAKSISELTGGAFDVTIYPIVKAWGFTTGQNKVPSEAELSEAKEKCGYEKLSAGSQAVLQGTEIDLGGIAKGYACDKALDILEKHGIEKAIVSSGSSILLKGKDWRVGVLHPLKTDELICKLTVSDTSVVSSGGYQRFFEEDGITYHHIIDPITAHPADSGIISSTVICEDATLADALSTAIYVMGVQKAIELYKSHGGFDMILVTNSCVYSTLDVELCDKAFELNIIE